MSDAPFYAPNRSAAARQPRVAEPLWAVQKEGRQLACELRDDGVLGVEVQVYRDGELLYGRRWPTRALALEKAEDWKVQYLLAGAVIIP
jgi:hypothetical protein